MSISSIHSTSDYYDKLASGKRITKAADDPAGSVIAQELQKQVNGYDVGYNNAATGQDLLNVSDGALGGITDALQRIRELGLQASNTAVYSSDDIQDMQDEVDQLKQQIQETAKGTEFNTMDLLDGSKADLNLATNPRGTGMQIGLYNSTLESLGIDDYDLTKNPDISTIDDAIRKVTDSRTKNAADSNALSYQMDYNNIAGENMASSQSNIEDLDYGQYISDMKRDQIMQQFRYFAQKQETANGLYVQKLLT